ncbi:metalloprotease TIKI1-like [Pollicipes pollicipes]|uniref:metalloprotease TIKI1-like n=1 Tax=Pollicipes pollicipes TaxID=41117 RepID=UPI0018859078|nr:metalloprotease TIKI1-like [Pollicipes pollicipes]
MALAAVREILRRGVIVVVILVSAGVGETAARKRSSRPEYCDKQTRQSSFLWRINTSPPSYFFGTIHVPYDRVWSHIPDNVKRAFHLSDAVFFELDLTNSETVSALTKCQLLPRGSRLDQLLPSDIYRRLQKHLDYVRHMMPLWMTADQRGRGLYADYLFNAITGNWQQKRPVWVMLMVNTLTESDVRSRGVPVLDLYLALEAEKRNKRTGAVERVEEQCLPLNGLGMPQVVFALNQTLNQHENIRAGQGAPPYTTEDLIKHYNCGDLDEVIFRRDSSQIPPSVFQVPPLRATVPASSAADSITARTIDRYFRDELIYKRNRRMGERILELLWTHPHTSFFFAFGAGHFLGNFTVLEVLRQAGYKVTKVGPRERIRRFNRRKKPDDQELDFSGFPPADKFGQQSVSSGPSGATSPTVDGATFQSTRPSAPAGKKSYLENFSDLWVRIDDASKSQSATDSADVLAAENSVRVWFGLPPDPSARSACAILAPSAALLVALLLLVVTLSPPRTSASETAGKWQ